MNIFDFTLVLLTCKFVFQGDTMSGFIKQSNNQMSSFSFSFNCFKCASKLCLKIHSQHDNHLIEKNQTNHEIGTIL